MPAKRRDTTGKGSGAKARRAKKPPTPPPREESLDSQEPEEVPQEDVPTAEEGTPEGAPSQATRRKEKKARGAFKLKDQEEEAMVIEWVQENRLLWDQKDQNFKNKNQKDRLWAKKAQELGYEGQFLRTWYMDLRDFNTKLQRVQSRDGARVFTAREQWVMGQFQFLKEMIRHRRHRLHSVQSPAAAKAALESGNLEQAERLAAEERRSLEDVDRDSTSSWRSSKRQRGSQEEAEDQYLEVLRKELAESHKRLTALQEREPDDERAAYMKYVGKVVCKTTEDAYEDFQRVFMDWQARWKAQRQQQQQRYQPQQYQQHTTQHQWYSGSSESAQCQPPPHQWRQPTPQMQATSVWGSQSMDFKTNAYPSAVSGGPSPSDSTSLAPPALQHFHRHMVHSVAGDGQAVRLPNIHKSLKTEPTGVQSREEVGPGLHQENSMSLCIKEEPVEEEEQQELPFTIITVKTEEDEDTFSQQEKTEEENKDEDFAFDPGCSSGLLSSLNEKQMDTSEFSSAVNSTKSADKEPKRNKQYSCSVCSKQFTQRGNLGKHMRIHTGEKPFKCSLCDRTFAQKTHLESHLPTHTGEKPFTCPACNKCFSQKSNYVRHLATHTGEKRFSCPECGARFNLKQSLDRHIRGHTGEKAFSCPFCGKGFTREESLNCHMVVHTGEEMYKRGLKPFSCSECGIRFNEKHNLERHMGLHSGDRPFSCSICKKSYTQKDTLKTHMKSHTGERPYSCPLCNKNFPHKVSLTTHLQSHYGEKPFRCSVCNKGFTKKIYVEQHMKTHAVEDSASVAS